MPVVLQVKYLNICGLGTGTLLCSVASKVSQHMWPGTLLCSVASKVSQHMWPRDRPLLCSVTSKVSQHMWPRDRHTTMFCCK